MPHLRVFDPPMCCSTGVCGPVVDPELTRFAGDLDWAAAQGIVVERFNLAQRPDAFVGNPQVRALLDEAGDSCLPLVLVEGQVVACGTYPSREALAEATGLSSVWGSPSIYSEAVAELVAIGAAIASNCEPCFRAHYARARKLGVSATDMARAVQTAQAVKNVPANAMLNLAERYLQQPFLSAEDRPARLVLTMSPSNEAGCAPGSGCC